MTRSPVPAPLCLGRSRQLPSDQEAGPQLADGLALGAHTSTLVPCWSACLQVRWQGRHKRGAQTGGGSISLAVLAGRPRRRVFTLCPAVHGADLHARTGWSTGAKETDTR